MTRIECSQLNGAGHYLEVGDIKEIGRIEDFMKRKPSQIRVIGSYDKASTT
jgi:Tfp pilus assembly protein PilO